MNFLQHTSLKEEAVVTVSRASRTFLDVQYDSNEDDDDYLPEQVYFVLLFIYFTSFLRFLYVYLTFCCLIKR